MKKKICLYLLIFLMPLFSCSLSPYRVMQKNKEKALFAYHNNQFKKAFAYANKVLQMAQKQIKQDQYLATLERGKIAMDAGLYKQAIKDLETGEKRFLATLNGNQSFFNEKQSSLFLNDDRLEYELLSQEKSMLMAYLILLNGLNGNLLQAKQHLNHFKEVNDYLKLNKKIAIYFENPFLRYLMGLIYEKEQKFALAEEQYQIINQFFKGKKGFELSNKNQKSLKNRAGLVIFIEIGRSPTKISRKFMARMMYRGRIRRVMRIYYPEYKASYYTIKGCKVYINQKERGVSKLLYSYAANLLKYYKKNKKKIIINELRYGLVRSAIISRMQNRAYKPDKSKIIATGKNVAELTKSKITKNPAGIIKGKANLYMDKKKSGKFSFNTAKNVYKQRADTRSWLTLPGEIHVKRIRNIKPGIHRVQIFYLDSSGNIRGRSSVKKIKVKPGKLKIIHFRITF